MINTGGYLLTTGVIAGEILDKQHEIIATDSYEQLQKAGLKEGDIVWDIGCGSGVMTEYLAWAVGSSGHVYALDNNNAQLQLTRTRMKKKGLSHVTFVYGDVNTSSELVKNVADIVYCRHVLIHLKTPQKAIQQMCSLLKPGGLLVLQESTANVNPVMSDYLQTMIALADYYGEDFNIGRKLPNLCKKTGLFSEVTHYTSQVSMEIKDARQFILAKIEEWQDKAVQVGLTTIEKVAEWKTEINNLPPTAKTYFSEQTHVLAKKR